MREAIDLHAFKARFPLSEIVGRRVKLKQRGREWEGCCPFHNEKTPSFGVNDAKGHYHCFGCGAGGDVLRFVMESEGLGFLDAVRWLDGGNWPEVDPVELQRRVEREDAIRAAKIADSKAIWRTARPALNTPAETYARARGIILPLPGSVRFARCFAWKKYDETGEVGPDLPAAVCAVQDVAGNVVGIQRIFLAKGGKAKANMRAPKRSLGRVKGAAFRMGPAASELVVCEGPEEAWTLAQSLPGVSVWSTCGTGNLPGLELPEVVETVTLAGNNDAPGRAAVEAAALSFTAQGKRVRTMFPAPAFADFNDELRGITQ